MLWVFAFFLGVDVFDDSAPAIKIKTFYYTYPLIKKNEKHDSCLCETSLL